MYFVIDMTKKAGMGGYIDQKEVRQNQADAGVFKTRQKRIAEIIGHTI